MREAINGPVNRCGDGIKSPVCVKGKIMRSIIRCLLVVNILALLELGVSAAQAADKAADKTADKPQAQSQNQWRFTFHNGEWWYWLPENHWVYWRNNKWNDYNPRTFTSINSSGLMPAGRSAWNYGSQAVTDSDNRPFYGHSLSTLDRRPLEENEETGPFYGHALPSEVFGPCAQAARTVHSTVRHFILLSLARPTGGQIL